MEFKCKLTGCIIKYAIYDDHNCAIIDFPNFFETINSEKVKCFFLLLRSSIDHIKSKNIKKIRQYVSKYDWFNVFKDKTSWKLIHQNYFSDNYLIESDINDIIENISIGFGIDTILKF